MRDTPTLDFDAEKWLFERLCDWNATRNFDYQSPTDASKGLAPQLTALLNEARVDGYKKGNIDASIEHFNKSKGE